MLPSLQDRPWLPTLLREMAEAHGLEMALAFAKRFGGRHLYLPPRAASDHPVTHAFGIEMLEWLLTRPQHAGDGRSRVTRIVVPKGPDQDKAMRVKALRALLARPLTNDEVAAETGLHVRDVSRWRARFREDQARRQGDLFRPTAASGNRLPPPR